MKLVWNEWLKLFKKKSFFVAFLVMAVISIATAITLKQTILGENMGALDYINLVLALDGFGGLFVLIGLISTASIVSLEHHLGTVKFLLIREHSRSKILAAKYATVLLYYLVLLLFTLVISLFMGLILLGDSNMTVGVVIGNIASTIVYGMIYSTIAFMVSVLTRSTGATIGIAMFLYICEGIFMVLLSKYSWSKFTLFLNTDFSQFLTSKVSAQGTSLGFNSAIIAAYMLVFLVISFMVYNKRDM